MIDADEECIETANIISNKAGKYYNKPHPPQPGRPVFPLHAKHRIKQRSPPFNRSGKLPGNIQPAKHPTVFTVRFRRGLSESPAIIVNERSRRTDIRATESQISP